MSDIANRVQQIIVSHLNVDQSKVTPQANFTGDLGADSLDVVELVMAFEEEFSIEVPDDVAENLNTVGDVITYLEKTIA